MNRKAEKFFDAITLLREDLVEEAQGFRFRRQRPGWKKFGSLAACVMLVLSLGMLAILPKGCGGSADSSGNTSSAPMEAPPASNEAPPSYGNGIGSSGGTDGAPKPSGGTDEPGQSGEVRFMGRVLEVLEDGLLVEPFSDSLSIAGPIYVSAKGLEDLPEFYPGAVTEIVCEVIADGAAENVREIWLLEP